MCTNLRPGFAHDHNILHARVPGVTGYKVDDTPVNAHFGSPATDTIQRFVVDDYPVFHDSLRNK
jgi:hypothetical protein